MRTIVGRKIRRHKKERKVNNKKDYKIASWHLHPVSLQEKNLCGNGTSAEPNTSQLVTH